MSTDRDVVYHSVDGFDVKLDIYRPPTAGRRAAVIFFHGGGWRAGSKASMAPTAEAMAAIGYVGMPAQYRLLGDAPFPAQIDDVRAAIRWVREHAGRLDVDPANIILWGSSAGAHLSLLAAGTHDQVDGGSSAVAAVIAEHPPVEFHVGERVSRHTTPGATLLGEDCTESQAKDASPITHVSSTFPPTLLLHGTYDRMVNCAASEAMMRALRTAKAPVDLHLFHGHNHGFVHIPSIRRQVVAEADYFLDRLVFDADRYESETLENSMFARRAAEAAKERQDGRSALPGPGWAEAWQL